MVKTYCAICEKTQSLVELYRQTIDFNKVTEKTFSARRTPDRIHYRFVKCLNCGLIFSNPILKTREINKFYKKSHFTYTNESNYLRETYKHFFEQSLKKLDIKNITKLKVLEIGCGNGFFLDEIKKTLGIKSVFGVEPSKPSVNKAPKDIKKQIKINILRPNLFKNSSFDVVCCFHTLDHITDPNSFLKICYKLLKKNGFILFIVHNTEGFSVKLFGEGSAIFDIEHVYLFNPQSLKRIFEKNTFKVKSLIDIKNKYPVHYLIRMTPLPKLIKSATLKILKLTGLGKIPLSISPGNIGIIAKK